MAKYDFYFYVEMCYTVILGIPHEIVDAYTEHFCKRYNIFCKQI